MNNDYILEIGTALAKERNSGALLKQILVTAMEITHADGGTFYTVENGELHFRIMRTLSRGIDRGSDGEKLNIPPVPIDEHHVSGYASKHNVTLYFDDVYASEGFDFSGTREYDALNGYRTQSMLVVPLTDAMGTPIGVLQLINATNEQGVTVPFDKDKRNVVALLSSFSIVALTSMRHQHEIKSLMFSFFNVIITAVEKRTPYNATHTTRIVEILLSFIDYVNATPEAASVTGVFDKDRTELIVMCAWLHDIGKLVTPLEVINKATRLGNAYDRVMTRFDTIQMMAHLRCCRGELTQAERDEICAAAQQARSAVQQANTVPFVDDDLRSEIAHIASRTFLSFYGETRPWLERSETEALQIRRGTLTDEERKIMEQHAVITTVLLEKMDFSKHFSPVLQWAGEHHEKLDGTGYPNGLKGDEISTEVRILTVLDIFEALTTGERPYKKSMTPEQAFGVLHSMSQSGQLDSHIIAVFERSRAWEVPGKMADYIEHEVNTF